MLEIFKFAYFVGKELDLFFEEVPIISQNC